MDATAIYILSTLPRVLPSFQLDRECCHGISNHQWVSANIQMKLAEQVTSVSTTLSGSFLISRQVSASREATTETVANTSPSGINKSQCWHGKAFPTDEFTGEDSQVLFDDWFTIVAATWNGWTKDELLMQLVGYLRGRALQEWKLLAEAYHCYSFKR